MSGSLLPNITRVNLGNPLYAPFGGGGGGGGPNLTVSTLTVNGQTTLLGDCDGVNATFTGAVRADTSLVTSSINCYEYQNVSTLTTGSGAFNFVNGNIVCGQGITGQSYLATLNYTSTPELIVSSINNAVYPPVPAYPVITRVATTGGTPSANGVTYTLPTGSTVVPLTGTINVLTNHLYRISCCLYDCANNDSTVTNTVIALYDSTATNIELPIWASNNNLLGTTAARGFCGISLVFQPLLTTLVVGARNNSATDTTTLEITLTGASAGAGFILEDLGVAPP